ncbi:Hypothetical protein, putative [Bodo saltans]|uniref:Uncharacterized protein n=1 Tax=Bodo saltans TaxID=75058 RepID=A0A0S4IHM1_BODSA|nr:Hypothetical protein, putative [Bodo saltans]|eukprot:CUE66414.1 Hypothetical protein, putative [Bodo saltans]
MTAGSSKPTTATSATIAATPAAVPLSTSDLMLQAHQIISFEATERETLLWEERKDIATLHVSLKRAQQLDNDRILQQQRRFEAACDSRIRTVERKMMLLDGEEQKLRLAILKSEVLQLEAIVRHCTKSIRGEVFTATQDAQQRIKYFNKTLDIILKKEAAARRDLLGMERYEFLVMKQRSDKEVTDKQREILLIRMRQTKQQQHDQERRRQEEAATHNNSNRSATVHSRYSVNNNSLNSTTQRRKSNALSSHSSHANTAGQQSLRQSAEKEPTRQTDDEELDEVAHDAPQDEEEESVKREQLAAHADDNGNHASVPRSDLHDARSPPSRALSSSRSRSPRSSRSASSRSSRSSGDSEGSPRSDNSTSPARESRHHRHDHSKQTTAPAAEAVMSPSTPAVAGWQPKRRNP